MKENKVVVVVILAAMLCATVQAAPESVKVSEFGYDPADSTEFIRKALASGAKKVTLDRQSGPWYTLPLKMPSNIEFVLEPGVELVAKRGEFRNKRDYLVELYGVTNVTLRGGEGSAFRMWKCDYQKPPYEKSEWRYALRIVRSRNVLVEGLKFLQSGGDGIGVSGDDITIRRCVCDGNHRQGMSVFSVRNLLVEDTVLSNTRGTAPQAGLDIEPDLASESLKNVVFRNCTSFGNAGNGFETYLVQLNKKSGPVDITFENCRSWGNSNDAIITCDNRKGQEHVTGMIRYLNCKFGPSRHANVKLAAIPANSVDVQFVDTVLTNASKSSAVQISVSNPRYGRPCGLDFGNLTVYDDGEWFKCTGEGMSREVDVRGDVTVISSNGVRRSERLDCAWMDRHLPLFDNGRPLPDVVKMPSPDDVKVCDACPGELAETEPFTILYQTPVVFFAEKAGPCRFMVRQVNAVPGRKLATEPLVIVPEGGGKQTRIPAPGEKSTEVVFHAKSRGFYRILPPKWGTRLRIDSTAVPMGIDVRSGKCVVAPLGGKRFSLSFASSGEPFTFVAMGGDYYRFKVDMFDANGGKCESDDIVDGQFIAHGEKGDAPGFRKAVFSRAKEPCYDHINIRLYGGGGFFFLSEAKRWRTDCGSAVAAAGTEKGVLIASGSDYHVDPVGGNDSHDGRSPDRAFKTLDHASRLLKAGDTLHLKAGSIFKEPLRFRSSGTSAKPIRVKGNGAILSGLEPVSDDSWTDQGDGLWLSTNKMFWGACRPRVLLQDRTMVSVEVRDPAFKNPKLLKAGQAAWNAKGIWFKCAPGKRPQDYRLSGYYRVSGVEVANRHNWIVENLIVEHFTNDGINVHGLCRGLYFFDIVARQNGDDGFSIHENVYASVRNLHVWGNDFGISDISQSQSVFSGVVAESNRVCGVDFHGGIRILRDATVRNNQGNQISISTGAKGKEAGDPNPMLRGTVLLEDVRVEGGEGAGVSVKPGCTVSILNSRICGVQTGLKLEGGRVHLENSKVERCAQILEKAPDCDFTCAEKR